MNRWEVLRERVNGESERYDPGAIRAKGLPLWVSHITYKNKNKKMNTFLPTNYKVPVSGNYMKLEDGDNELLVLDSVILGYLYWNKEDKPVRLKERPAAIPEDIRYETDDQTGQSKPDKIKHFWAFPVWNVAGQCVQVLEITQKGIMGGLQALAQNEKWGDPILNYSITISRKGQGFDTEYTVVPNPKEPVPAEILAAWDSVKAAGFDITRLYDGGDPFVAA